MQISRCPSLRVHFVFLKMEPWPGCGTGSGSLVQHKCCAWELCPQEEKAAGPIGRSSEGAPTSLAATPNPYKGLVLAFWGPCELPRLPSAQDGRGSRPLLTGLWLFSSGFTGKLSHELPRQRCPWLYRETQEIAQPHPDRPWLFPRGLLHLSRLLFQAVLLVLPRYGLLGVLWDGSFTAAIRNSGRSRTLMWGKSLSGKKP